MVNIETGEIVGAGANHGDTARATPGWDPRTNPSVAGIFGNPPQTVAGRRIPGEVSTVTSAPDRNLDKQRFKLWAQAVYGSDVKIGHRP